MTAVKLCATEHAVLHAVLWASGMAAWWPSGQKSLHAVLRCAVLYYAAGIWRGSLVAIKTMVLPAKMSGAEKRERMAIMEAAISSAMNHPNIVQTYTYIIKPSSSSVACAQSSE